MKLHTGWLATGLLLFALLACNLSKNNNNANNSNKNSNENKPAKAQPTRPANADVYVNRVYMAKDKNGQPGDETTSYDPTDHMVHCIIELNKVHGHLQLPSDRPKGTYRVEVYINGNLDKTIDYTIE